MFASLTAGLIKKKTTKGGIFSIVNVVRKKIVSFGRIKKAEPIGSQ
jgi:hypothetical protein